MTETVHCGKVTVYCDKKAALTEVFDKPKQSNNPFKQLQADADLITCARDLLLWLSTRINVKHEWVKGHYTGTKRKLQHDLNDIADDLTGSFNSKQRTTKQVPPVLHPLYEAELVHNNCIVTSKLHHIISTSLHSTPVQNYIAKSTGWPVATLDKIDWDAQKMAMGHFSRTQHISITKLAHGLYQTSRKDNMYYGASDLCPCCRETTETLAHIFTCRSPLVTDDSLHQLGTPKKILHAITHELNEWESSLPATTPCIRPPYRGTVLPADCSLIQAFLEQTNDIGWDQFLRGRISTKWSKAYQLYCSKPHQEPIRATPWATQVVRLIWTYSSNLWKFRNGVKYGHT